MKAVKLVTAQLSNEMFDLGVTIDEIDALADIVSEETASLAGSDPRFRQLDVLANMLAKATQVARARFQKAGVGQ